jgi:pimeloyl-ACP methyl ester carboxylesterase
MWADALGAYLKSGGYARRVGREMIRRIPQPTLVIWGADDPILPLSDARAFQRDLPRCVGVREVPGCGHTPQLESPEVVAQHIAQFASSKLS